MAEMFAAAERLMPRNLKNAIKNERISELEDVLNGVKSSYINFPERKPPEIVELENQAMAVKDLLVQDAEYRLDVYVKKSLKRTVKRNDISEEHLDCISEVAHGKDIGCGDDGAASSNVQYQAKFRLKAFEKSIDSALSLLLSTASGEDELARLRHVAQQHKTNKANATVVALALKKIASFEKALARFQSKQQSGQVSVAAALKGIQAQLTQVVQRGNIAEQEDVIERASQIMELAGARDVEWPGGKEMEIQFKQALSQISASAQQLNELVEKVVVILQMIKTRSNATQVQRLEAEVQKIEQTVKLTTQELSNHVVAALGNVLEAQASQVSQGIQQDKVLQVLEARLQQKIKELRQERASEREADAVVGLKEALRKLNLGNDRDGLQGVCEFIVLRNPDKLETHRSRHVADVFEDQDYSRDAGMLILAQERLEGIKEQELTSQLRHWNGILDRQVPTKEEWSNALNSLRVVHDAANSWIPCLVVPKGAKAGVWRPAALIPLLNHAKEVLMWGGASCRHHKLAYEPPRDKVEDRKHEREFSAKCQKAMDEFDKSIKYRSRVSREIYQQVHGREHIIAACKKLRSARAAIAKDIEHEPWGPTFNCTTPDSLTSKLNEMDAKLRQDNLGYWALLRECVVPGYSDAGSILEYWISSTNKPVAKTELLNRLKGAGFGQREFRLRIWTGLFGALMVILGLFFMIWSLIILHDDIGYFDGDVETFTVVAVVEGALLTAVGIASSVLAYKDPAAHNMMPLCVFLLIGAAGQIALSVWCLVDSSNARDKLVGSDGKEQQLWSDHKNSFVISLFVCAILEIACSSLFLWHRRLNQKKKQMWYGADSFEPVLKFSGHHGSPDDLDGVSLQVNPTLDETLQV